MTFSDPLASEITDPRVAFEKGMLASQQKDWKRAAQFYEQVTALAPTVEVGHFNLGNVYFELKRFDRASDSYRNALALSNEAATWNNLGNSLAEWMQFEDAIQSYRTALSMQSIEAPLRAQCQFNLGRALQTIGNWEEAESAYRKSWELKSGNPRLVEPYLETLALLGCAENRWVELGVQFGTAALEMEACKLEACFGLSGLYQRMGRWDLSLSYLVQAVDWFPNEPAAFARLAQHHSLRGRISEATACIHRAATLANPTPSLFSHWVQNLQYSSSNTAAKVLDEARQWNQIDANSSLSQPAIEIDGELDPSEADSRPVIAILASDEFSESVEFELVPYLQTRDTNRFRIHLYWNSFDQGPLAMQLKALVDRWIPCQPTSDPSIAARMQQVKTRLLVDTIGHGPHTRLGVSKQKPAPVSVLWNYTQQTTGVSTLRYRMSSGESSVRDARSAMTEDWLGIRFPPARLEGIGVPSEVRSGEDPSRIDSESSILKATENSLSGSKEAKAIRFGFAGSMRWVTHESFDWWSALLLATPESTFCFIAPEYRDSTLQDEVRGGFTRRGVSGERVHFDLLENSPDDGSMLRWLEALDVYAESFPIHSMVSTIDAIQRGCLVIGCSGDSAPRSSLTELSQICPNSVVVHKTIQESVDAFSAWVTDGGLTTEKRQHRIEQTLLRNPFDAKEYALSIEDAWEIAIRRSTESNSQQSL